MEVLVDTCGWIEWLTDSVLADRFQPYFKESETLVVPYRSSKLIHAKNQ